MNQYTQFINEDLIHLIKKDDKLAFEELYNRFIERLYLQSYFITKNEDSSKEIVQELFIKIWEKRQQLPIDINVDAYLFIANKNNTLKYISREKHHLDIFQLNIENLVQYELSLSFKELQTIIDEEIQNLPKKMREVFIYSRSEEYSYKKIASLLNISEKTVKKQISNALKILRFKLQKRDINYILICLMLYKN